MKPNQYISANRNNLFPPTGNAILFYPGAYTDYGPLDMLVTPNEAGMIAGAITAIYVDYWITQEKIIEFGDKIRRHYSVGFPIVFDLSPSDFGLKSLDAFYPKTWTLKQKEFYQPKGQTVLGKRLYFHELNLTLLYLVAEAIQVYKIIQRCNVYPNMVVLQEHGMVGLWTEFGGESLLYKASRKKPKFLYVAKNTIPWPNYHAVSETQVDIGQMHNHERRIYII